MVRLGYLAENTGNLGDLGPRVEALDLAIIDREPRWLSFALGPTGPVPPPSVEAWNYGGTGVADLPEVAVWLLADAACKLAAHHDLSALRPVAPALDAWAATLPTQVLSADGTRHSLPG